MERRTFLQGLAAEGLGLMRPKENQAQQAKKLDLADVDKLDDIINNRSMTRRSFLKKFGKKSAAILSNVPNVLSKITDSPILPAIKKISRYNNMQHFANFANIYETGLKNLLTNTTEPVAKKYIRKKKEEREAEKQG